MKTGVYENRSYLQELNLQGTVFKNGSLIPCNKYCLCVVRKNRYMSSEHLYGYF